MVMEKLMPWLLLLHARAPGGHFFLVCTHAELPPADAPLSLEQWRAFVRALADEVLRQVRGRDACRRLLCAC
jgi:hypothetical protein